MSRKKSYGTNSNVKMHQNMYLQLYWEILLNIEYGVLYILCTIIKLAKGLEPKGVWQLSSPCVVEIIKCNNQNNYILVNKTKMELFDFLHFPSLRKTFEILPITWVSIIDSVISIWV